MNNEKELLTKIENTISGNQIHKKLVASVLKDICTYTEWQYGEAWKLNDDKTNMLFYTSWFVDASYEKYKNFSSICKFSPGIGLVGKAWADGKPVWMDNLADHFNFIRTDIAERSGFTAGYAVPVKENNKIHGIFIFFLSRIHHGDELKRNTVANVVSRLSLNY